MAGTGLSPWLIVGLADAAARRREERPSRRTSVGRVRLVLAAPWQQVEIWTAKYPRTVALTEMYYIKGGDVWATPRKQKGQPKDKAQKIAATGIELDYSKYIYFLDGVP